MPEKAQVDSPGQCLNCGTDIVGEYCSACGQKEADRLPTLATFLADSVRSLADLDGPAWSSARCLFTVPGGPARDFVAGRRVSTLHPVRAFTLAAMLAFTLVVAVPRSRMGMIFALVGAIPNNSGGDWGPWIVLLVTVPLMAAVLHVLLIRHGRRYLEHLVVCLFYFTVVMLIASLETLVRTAVGGGDPLIFTLFAGSGLFLLAHGTFVLRRVYEITIPGAMWRVAVLALVYAAGVGYFFVRIGGAGGAAS